MKTITRFLGTFVIAGLAALFSSGCTSLKAISSTPPVKAVVVVQPVEFKFGLGETMTMPAGEYKPALEDDKAYYYQAPSKLVARDIFPYVSDGGLVIKRGEKIPTRWYSIDQQNMFSGGKLPANFPAKIVE